MVSEELKLCLSANTTCTLSTAVSDKEVFQLKVQLLMRLISCQYLSHSDSNYHALARADDTC